MIPAPGTATSCHVKENSAAFRSMRGVHRGWHHTLDDCPGTKTRPSRQRGCLAVPRPAARTEDWYRSSSGSHHSRRHGLRLAGARPRALPSPAVVLLRLGIFGDVLAWPVSERAHIASIVSGLQYVWSSGPSRKSGPNLRRVEVSTGCSSTHSKAEDLPATREGWPPPPAFSLGGNGRPEASPAC